MRQRVVSSLGLFVLLAACKSSTPAPASVTPPDGETPSAAEAPDAAPAVTVPATWAEAEQADLDTQIAYMKANVIPAMQPKFAEAHPDFGCATCHGPDNKPPQEFLPHLSMADGQIAEFASMPDVSKYMAEAIVPAMAEAMGEAPYDPATGEGFGCAGCHTIDPG